MLEIKTTDVVIVSSKPMMTQLLVESLQDANPWEGRRIIFVHAMYFGAFRFAYPRGCTWSDYPLILEPSYQLDEKRGFLRPKVLQDGALVSLEERDGWKALAEVPEIIYAADPWHSEYVSFMLMLRHVGREVEIPNIPCVSLASIRTEAIRKAIKESCFRRLGLNCRLLGFGLAKRYFDFNWNMNAQAILGRTLRNLGYPNDVMAPSKFALQLLFYIRRQPTEKVVTDCNLSVAMESGLIGSGRYGKVEVGSPASRGPIVQQLHDASWVTRTPRGFVDRPQLVLTAAGRERLDEFLDDPETPHAGGPHLLACSLAGAVGDSQLRITQKDREALVPAGLAEVVMESRRLGDRLSLSPAGEAFLDALHPDCEDLDLAGRLDAWCNAGLEVSKPSIDRYIKTFFGKQKRFVAKQSH